MEVQELIRNLVRMEELLHAPTCSLRLVTTPDRMVVKEAMRTFTYLNLFGYLTDAVVVNRVFPDAVDGTYFGAWRTLQQEQLELVRDGFGPVPVLCAPYFECEVSGPAMLDRLAGELYAGVDPAGLLHATVSQQLRQDGERAELRLELPFASKGDISLKKIGLELVVRVGDAKRVIELPSALVAYRPLSATFENGALVVAFEPAAEAVTAGA
jgi:arsenite-transporting ATPase